jgi:hypothetical protein
VHDPLLGPLRRDNRSGWYESEPKPVRFLGKACRFVFDDYGSEEVELLEVRRAAQHALDAGPEVLAAAEPYAAPRALGAEAPVGAARRAEAREVARVDARLLELGAEAVLLAHHGAAAVGVP